MSTSYSTDCRGFACATYHRVHRVVGGRISSSFTSDYVANNLGVVWADDRSARTLSVWEVVEEVPTVDTSHFWGFPTKVDG